MSVIKISDSVYSVGVLNPALRIFDVVMRTEFGTTYNSYIIKGSEKTVLVETCHLSFFDVYLSNIKEVCPPEKIDYIILNHCEPDHSGSLRRLLELCPCAKIIVSTAGAIYLKNITNIDSLPIITVKDGDTLSLGDSELKFINAPFLHWPDSMFTWFENEKALFSCDFLGAHYCEPYAFDTNVIYDLKYESAFKNYYDAIFSPFKPYVLKGLEKIKDLAIEYACVSHGPVLTKGCKLEYAIKNYSDWSLPDAKAVKKIPVFYCSAYGNTEILAEIIRDSIKEKLNDAQVNIYDVNEFPSDFLAAEINSCDALAIGSPTINADAVAPIWQLLSHVDAINCKKKNALVFGSFGWSGEALPNISARLQGLKMNVFEKNISARFVPGENEIAEAKKIAAEFARIL